MGSSKRTVPEKDDVVQTTEFEKAKPSSCPSAIVPDQGWAWLILFGSFCCNICVGGVLYSFGVFFLEILDHYGESRAVTAWVGSTIAGTYAAIGPVASVLSNRFGCKFTTVVGGLLTCTGFILSTFSPNIWVMILTYGLMGGIGFGFSYLTGFIMISNYFVKYRALATGIASSGSGVGTFLFAPLCTVLIETYAWKGALWVVSAITLHACVMGSTYRALPLVENQGIKQRPKLLNLSLLKEPACAGVCLATFLSMVGYYIPFVFIPDLTESIGIGRSKGAILLGIVGLSNTIGRILSGVLINVGFIGPLKLYVFGFLMGGIATITVPWLTMFPLLCIFSVFFGFSFGGSVSLGAIILQEYLGVESISNSFGFLSLFRGIATLISGPLAGLLYDWTGNHMWMFIIAGVTISAAGLSTIPLTKLQSWHLSHKMDTNSNNTSNDIQMTVNSLSEVS